MSAGYTPGLKVSARTRHHVRRRLPVAGDVLVEEGQQVGSGDVVIILEAMKMETEVRATRGGRVVSITVREGDSVQIGAALLYLA